MRALWVVTLVFAFACKGKKEAPVKLPPVPAVAVATAIAKESDKPPALFIIEEAGVRVAAARTWADIDAGKLKITKKPSKLERVDRHSREDFALGRTALDTVEMLNEVSDDAAVVDLEALEDPPPPEMDDPPPPEEEDAPDDGEDESGGTGTAITLEEGKMGKKDSDRAEGQYKMKKNTEDPQLARQQAIEQARKAGILGTAAKTGGVEPYAMGAFGVQDQDGWPVRAVEVQGTVIPDGKIADLRAMILIAPSAPAASLVSAIQVTNAAIAVSHAGKLRPLRLSFSRDDAPGVASSPWVEARVAINSITVEAVPDRPATVLDLKELGAAIDKARKGRGIEDDVPVDVLVDPNVNAQRLVDVLVALDASGARFIGMGPKLDDKALALRGHRIPTATLGQPNAQGDLDKALIRRVVRRDALPKVKQCYENALENQPDLAGTLQTQFFITPKGTVQEANASGVDDKVAKCVAAVIKTLQFPEPRGGGGVQVSYPFTLRP